MSQGFQAQREDPRIYVSVNSTYIEKFCGSVEVLLYKIWAVRVFSQKKGILWFNSLLIHQTGCLNDEKTVSSAGLRVTSWFIVVSANM